jgi:hypothetical protein
MSWTDASSASALWAVGDGTTLTERFVITQLICLLVKKTTISSKEMDYFILY